MRFDSHRTSVYVPFDSAPSPRNKVVLFLLFALVAATPTQSLAAPLASPVEPTFTAPRVAEAKKSKAPAGYVEMTVAALAPSGREASVALIKPGKNRIISFGINVEAAAHIYARITKAASPLPSTHDLMDDILLRAGLSVRRVQIDTLEGQHYRASLHLFDDDGAMQLQSRPSDVIAIAIKHEVPIYVSKKLIKEHGEAVPAGYKFPPIR